MIFFCILVITIAATIAGMRVTASENYIIHWNVCGG